MARGDMVSTKTYYEVLGLPKNANTSEALSSQLVKAAYRRALLQHHPDKARLAGDIEPMAVGRQEVFSIDQITEAYTTLSNPKLRLDYDKSQRLQNAATMGNGSQGKEPFRTGVEIVDLDDLEFDEGGGVWFRSCRCGDERGFLVREEDLEDAAEDGELNVGCKGCSLWLRVLFGIA